MIINTLFNNISSTGIVRLFTEKNLSRTKWLTSSQVGAVESISKSVLLNFTLAYFKVPNGFININDNFYFNFGFKYVFKERKVFVGDRVGRTEPFWHLEPNEPIKCELMTDDKSGYPYLIVPNSQIGDINAKSDERRYFTNLIKGIRNGRL